MDASVWTPEARTRVATLLRLGQSASHIARQLHATRNSIISVVHRDRELKAIGFARSSGGKPKPNKKPPMHRPDNRIAALIKPRLVNRNPDTDEPQRRKPKPPLPPAWPIVPRNIPMADIGICQCRFPMWDGDGAPDFLMCGADTALEQSYCAGHKAKVFTVRGGGDG